MRLVFVLLLLLIACRPDTTLEGPYRVSSVTDGDTLVLERLGPVRLIGVDTPEKRYNERLERQAEARRLKPWEVQRQGEAASRFTRALVQGRPVWLERGREERDRYNRLLAYAYLQDPGGDWRFGEARFKQVNQEIIREGWAEPLVVRPNDKYADRYELAVGEAKRKGTGIWAKASAPPAPGTAAGNAAPQNGNCPRGFPVKGNISSRGRTYHPTDSPSYAQTRPEVCFANPREAERAGFSRVRN